MHSWEQRKLGNTSKKVCVGFVGTCEKYYTDETGIPMYRTGNLNGLSLNKDDMKKITALLMKELVKRAEDQLDIELTVRDSARTYIVEKAYDKKYGARPLKRKIQDEIENRLAEDIINGRIKRGDKVIVSTKNKQISLTVEAE